MVSKSWCFTLNNYTDEDECIIKEFEYNYLVYGREIAPTTKTPHLQGFVTFKKSMRLSGLKTLHEKIHWIVAKGSKEQNRVYCCKEGQFFESQPSKQGERTDLTLLADSIKTKGLKKAIEENPGSFIRYHSGMTKFAESLHDDTPRNFKPEVYWIYGKSGCGKTKYVSEKEKDLWWSGVDLKWWQGYNNQEAVVFDDFRGDMCKFRWLLRLLDRTPVTVEVKGGSKQFNSKRIYITSINPPEAAYKVTELDGEPLTQLTRRITKVIQLGVVTDVVTVTEVVGNTSQQLVTQKAADIKIKHWNFDDSTDEEEVICN